MVPYQLTMMRLSRMCLQRVTARGNLLLYCLIQILPINGEPFDFGYWKKNWSECLEEHKIIPDVIAKKPPNWLEACYVIYSVSYGNHLSQFYIDEPPNDMKWKHENDSEYFTALLTGPDAPVDFDPSEREWLHWLVVNIPGNNYRKGEVLTEYEAPGDCYATGRHRYVFVVFKQPGNKKMKFHETTISKGEKDENRRAKFSTLGFAKKHGLGDPWAANFFITDLDDLFSDDNIQPL